MNTRKKNCILQFFSRCSFDFPSKTIFPLVIKHYQKSKWQRRLRAQSHLSNQSPRQWVFANPFCVCKCHIWVQLCAEQLCGFCTSRSPIGFGKWPLQLVISQFDMPPLYLYIIIPFTRIESKIAQWQNQSAKLATTKVRCVICFKNILRILQWRRHTCTEQKKVTFLYMEWNRQCSQSGQEEPHKAKPLQDASKVCQCTRCSETSQPLWNEVSIAVQP